MISLRRVQFEVTNISQLLSDIERANKVGKTCV